MSRAAVLVCLLGCGRVGFDAASTGDAGALDGSGADAAGALCTRFPAALWCNDFEDGDLGSASEPASGRLVAGVGWQGSTGYAMVAEPGDSEYLQISLPAPITDGTLHIAGRLHLASGASTLSFVVIAQALGPTFDKVSFDLNSSDRVQIVNTVAGGGIQGNPDSFPRGRFTCHELEIQVSAGANGAVFLSIDDVRTLTGWQGEATLPAGGFTKIEIGLMSAGANPETISAVFDNLIVDVSPIGCP
jgi:hypothetical protein